MCEVEVVVKDIDGASFVGGVMIDVDEREGRVLVQLLGKNKEQRWLPRKVSHACGRPPSHPPHAARCTPHATRRRDALQQQPQEEEEGWAALGCVVGRLLQMPSRGAAEGRRWLPRSARSGCGAVDDSIAVVEAQLGLLSRACLCTCAFQLSTA